MSIPARMRPLLVAIAALLAIPALPSPARAGQPIVLESYAGERPADAERVLGPVIDELAKNRFVSGPAAVGRKFESAVSRPAVGGGLPDDFTASVARGYDLWTNGKFNEAASILGPLIELARANPGEFARNQSGSLYPELQKALIALALSQLKLGDRGTARQILGEALRGNPELKISRGMYGQEASALHDEVVRDLTGRGTGKVIVAASGAGLYVNERLVGMGKLEEHLLPGEYRVVARFGNEVSRAHRIVIAGGDIHQLTIDPALDRAVHTGPDWTGLLYERGADRERDETFHGAAVARAIDAEQIVIVGIDTVRGRRMIKGALINRDTGRELRSGSIPLDASPSEEQRRNLARFLNGAPATPDIIVGVAPGAGRAARLGRAPWGGWTWLAGGAAIAAGVAGGALLAYDGRCAQQVVPPAPCPDHYDTAAQGWIAIGGAVALAGITVYLVVRERGADGEWRTAYVAPAAGGAIAGYAARF